MCSGTAKAANKQESPSNLADSTTMFQGAIVWFLCIGTKLTLRSLELVAALYLAETALSTAEIRYSLQSLVGTSHLLPKGAFSSLVRG